MPGKTMNGAPWCCLGLSAALTFALAPPLAAQSVACDLTKSGADCLAASSRGTQIARAAAVRAGTSAVADAAAAKPTGNAAAVTESQSAIRDFLPRFATALAIPGLSAMPKALGMSFNTPANDPVWRLPFALKVEGVAREPFLSDALVKAIPMALRPTVKDSVTKTLAEFADLRFALALNLENRTWGRSVRSNKDTIDAILAGMFMRDLPALIDAQTALASDEIDSLKPVNGAACGDGVRARMALNCFTAVDRQKIIDAVLGISQTFNDFADLAKRRLRDTHLDRLSDLINQQRQFSVNSDATLRAALVGPNEQKIGVRYEWSPVSLNAAREFCHGALAFGCLTAYLAQDGIMRGLDAGHRFWFAADLSNMTGYDFALVADTARVVKPRSWAIEPAMGYGSYVGIADQRVRIDIDLRYRRSNDQSVRDDRATSSASLTQKVSDQSNAVFTITWASRPEYLGAVDKAWGANIGYSYKLSDAVK